MWDNIKWPNTGINGIAEGKKEANTGKKEHRKYSGPKLPKFENVYDKTTKCC